MAFRGFGAVQLQFTKMQSLGNDFVVIDGVSQSIALDRASAELIADRHRGIGCDQILVVEKATDSNSDFRFRIFNADGSEVGQCGNGARCFLKFVIDKGLTNSSRVRMQTTTSVMVAEMNADSSVTVDMGEPVFVPAAIPFDAPKQVDEYPLSLDCGTITIGAVSMGNPHAVQRVSELDDATVLGQGPQIEAHSRFPENTNAGFMQVITPEHIRLRVYERGVGETQACGSGACAAVAVGRLQGHLDETVAVDLPGGRLNISWRGSGHPVLMTGPADTVFEGQIKL